MKNYIKQDIIDKALDKNIHVVNTKKVLDVIKEEYMIVHRSDMMKIMDLLSEASSEKQTYDFKARAFSVASGILNSFASENNDK